MKFFDWLFGVKRHRSRKGWRRIEEPPRWARKVLMEGIHGKFNIVYTKGRHFEYKLVVKPNMDAGHFDWIYYRRKRK
jgi:hypothetical protein